jgi:hypothetical protein
VSRASRPRRWSRWWGQISRLRHPGPPPLGTVALTAALLAIACVALAVLIALGLVHHDRAARYFGEGRAGNYFSALQLFACFVAAACVAWKIRRHPSRGFWWMIAGAMLLLSLDEGFGLHEELDVGIHKLMGWHDRRHWLTDHLDDTFVALYGLIALLWAERHLEEIVRLRWTAVLLATAFLCFVAMAVLDFTGFVASLEEGLELISESLILSALITAYRDPALASSA